MLLAYHLPKRDDLLLGEKLKAELLQGIKLD